MFTNQKYLRAEQYRDAGNLKARIALHSRFSTNPYGWFRWVFDQLGLPPHSRLLELGCGVGDLWVENSDRLPQRWEIHLSDFSLGMLGQASHRLDSDLGNYYFHVIDAQAIPFQEGVFEAVIANHMLYHVPDMQLALSEIRRVLKPGGLLLAATNGLDHMQEIKTLVRRADPQAAYSGADLSFRLENGGELLEPFFSSAQLHRYEDALRITEAAPLIDYILSMIDLRGISLEGGRLESFNKSIALEIARQGAIHITKSACLFVCQR